MMGVPAMQNEALKACKGEAGRVVPLVDRNRCEAKAGCVQACPFGVFEIRHLEASDRALLSFVGRVKTWAHGNRQAFVVRPDDCRACRMCVEACPESAIRLVPHPPA